MKKKKGKKYGKLDRKLMGIGILFLLPAAVLIGFTTVIPIIWNIVLSLSNWNGNGALEFTGLDNYMKLFSDTATLKTIRNSMVVAIGSTVVSMVLGILLALMIYKMGKKKSEAKRS